ncbi:MAG: hypothetical protein ACI87E_005240 [Mariniblastus sp.]|jgi:hypothetical protein
MKTPTHEIEALLARHAPEVPDDLRGDVEVGINQSLKRQMVWDDTKWLATTVGILILVVVGQWAALSFSHQRLESLSRSTIASPETAKAIAAYVSRDE